MRTKIRVISKLRRAAGVNWLAGALAALALVTVCPTVSHATDVIASGGLYDNGVGGLGIDGLTDHALWLGSGSNPAVAKTLPDCTDTAGNHLNYTRSTHAFSCGTSSSTSTVKINKGFVTQSDVDLNGSSVFVSINGVVSATEAKTQVPYSIARTISDFSCASTSTPGGTSLKAQIQAGTAGAGLTYACGGSDLCATITGTTPSTLDTDTLAVTSLQVVAIKITAVGDTANGRISCSWSES